MEVDMHKIFGIKDNKIYLDRKGAYLIPIRGEKVGVVEIFYQAAELMVMKQITSALFENVLKKQDIKLR